MEQKDIQFQKKRDLGLVISDSFEFLRQEAKPIFKVLAIYVLPFLILYAYGQIYFQKNIASQFDLTDQETLMQNIGPFYKNLFLFMFFGIFILRYQFELILMTPLIAGFISYYVKISFNKESAVQSPERLYRERLLMGYAGLCVICFFVLLFVNIPIMYQWFNVIQHRLPVLWVF